MKQLNIRNMIKTKHQRHIVFTSEMLHNTLMNEIPQRLFTSSVVPLV